MVLHCVGNTPCWRFFLFEFPTKFGSLYKIKIEIKKLSPTGKIGQCKIN